MGIVNLPAHFDGKHNLLNEPFQLEPNAKLAASVILVDDENEDELTHCSPADLERAYGEEEANTATESKNRNIEGLTPVGLGFIE